MWMLTRIAIIFYIFIIWGTGVTVMLFVSHILDFQTIQYSEHIKLDLFHIKRSLFKDHASEKIHIFKGHDYPEKIPIDLITFSASGVDPHISLESVLYQLPRIARIRDLDKSCLKDLLLSSQDTPYFNVLLLNLKVHNEAFSCARKFSFLGLENACQIVTVKK